MASFGVGFLLIAACFVVARGLAVVYWPLRPPGPGWPGAGAAGDDREGLTRFQASILLAGRTAIGIQVPAELVEALGKGRRPPVHATVNGYTYRNTVPSMRGAFLLPVSAEVRERAGVATVGALAPMGEAFMLWVSAEVREVAVPPDLADALDRDLDARRALDALSYSGWCWRSSRPRLLRRGGAWPGRSRSCGRAATDRSERALPSPSRGS